MAEVTKLCCVLFHVVFAWTICIDRTFAVNNRPVIGVLSQASRSSPGQSYILSSYIKYLEEGGARVVPIRIFEPETYYIQLFKSINGNKDFGTSPQPTPVAAPVSTPETTPQPTPEAHLNIWNARQPTPQPTPEATPQPTPEATPAYTRSSFKYLECTSQGTPETTPEATPHPACYTLSQHHWLREATPQTTPHPTPAYSSVLLPGGGADPVTSGYAQAARLLYKLAIEANDAGDYFPMWGICLGFEQLSVLVAGKNILSNFDAEDLNLPLNFTYPGFLHGRMFHEATAEIIGILKNQNVTANAHHEGVSPEVFFRNGKLKSFFRILSTNRDRQGKQFISSFEGFKYPIYGTQFHPEKNTFIWSKKYPWMHSKDAIKVTQYFTNFFVNEARRSNHAFMSEEMAVSAVIENYKPVYLKDTYPFESSYYFNFTRNVFQVVV